MARLPPHPALSRSFTRPPEWRMNPATGKWVIVAPERSARPMMPEMEAPPKNPTESCPFCEGAEAQTPVELFAIRAEESVADGPGWRVRAVPNSFPAVRLGGSPEQVHDGFYNYSRGVGLHELIVECPHHETNLARLTVQQVRDVVQVWRLRVGHASGVPFLRYAQLFKNHGSDAGASVEHSHSQLIATPMIPITVRDELSFALQYQQQHDTCVYCALIHRELSDGKRAIADKSSFFAFAAYAGRQPFETWILPKKHESQFAHITADEANELGTILWTVLRKIDLALGGPAYNLVFHTAPFHDSDSSHYHWHVEVLPRLTQIAGYEWGSGAHINPVLPEDAAEVLRDSAIESD